MARMDTDTEGAGGPNLAERIRRLANGRNTLDVAQFQFVGITDIRRRYGPRWPAKRDRVSQIASHFISRRIAPDDVLISGADGYLLVFGSLTGGAADQAARRISAELNAYFLGEPDFDDIQIGSQHHSMSIDDFAEAFGAMLAAAGRAPSPENAPIPSRWVSRLCGMPGPARCRPSSSRRSSGPRACRWTGTLARTAMPRWTNAS